ncbi:MAG: polysaccharide deacetylase family protein [Gammaproteobacteria bacterium]|nr:polysaccharide deacetylase family protein [Gammaproteobacteria bacterium]
MKAIITFHSIDNSGSVLSYPPKAFSCFMEALQESDLPVLGLDDLLQANTKRGIAITFDDGMRSLHKDALPILRDHAAPAHLYLTTGAVGNTNRWPTQPGGAPVFDMLSWDEIEQLHGAGVSIESHTHSHPDMRDLDNAAMEQECETADTLIEKRIGRRPGYFAYPYGYRNEQACDFVRRRYKAAVTTELGTLDGKEDSAKLPRLDSYYLRAGWMQRNLDSSLSRAYLSLRGWLRILRGTQ